MVIKFKKISLKFDISLLIILILTILSKDIFIYLYYYFLSYFFVLLHELSHVIVTIGLGYNVDLVTFKIGGVNASIDKYIILKKHLKYIFIAGPILNLVLLIIFKDNIEIFSINSILFIINMFPIKPLDGYNLFSIYCKKDKIKVVERVFLFFLFTITILLVYYRNNYSTVIIITYLLSLKIMKH